MKIEVKNLKKYFGKNKAVDDISFSFSKGNIFGFIGPNGAGKTTTIRIMSTLEEPDSGDIFFNGASIKEFPEDVRRLIGYMPDALPEHNDITVDEYIDFFARTFGLKGSKRRKAIAEINEFTGLGPLKNKYLKALSKGMKQRVSLARALVHDPQVLIMDEPAAGLDPRARIELRELMKILANNGKAIFVSSHILAELEDICHGTVIIEKGKILHASSTNNLLQKQKSPEQITVIFLRALINQELLLKKLAETPFVNSTTRSSNNEIKVIISGGDNEAFELLNNLLSQNIKIVEFRQQSLGLEELFMNVTKGDVN